MIMTILDEFFFLRKETTWTEMRHFKRRFSKFENDPIIDTTQYANTSHQTTDYYYYIHPGP